MADADHSKLYKNVGRADLTDSRRRRTENSIEIRRNRRNDEMMKRRHLNIDFDNDFEKDGMNRGKNDDVAEAQKPDSTNVNIGDDEDGKKSIGSTMTIEEAVAILINDPTVDDLRSAFAGIRRILSSARDPPIDLVIRAGLLDALVSALQINDERVQFEAAWALTNIVSGTSEQTMAAVDAGIVEHLVRLCTQSSDKVAEQVIWAIANIVGDSAKLRDMLIQAGVISAISQLVHRLSELSNSFVQIIAWTVSNLVRHKRPQVSFDVLQQIMPNIVKLLQHSDAATQQDTCWALSFLTDGADSHMELALHFGVVPIVLSFFTKNQPELIPPSLRVFGNLATGADHLTQVVVDTKILDSIIPHLLTTSTSPNIKECCWLVSNIAAGTHGQIQAIIDSGVLPLIVDVLQNGDHRGQSEASWVLANIVHGGTSQQILHLAGIPKTLPAVCEALYVKNNELIVNMLETLYGMLNAIRIHSPNDAKRAELLVEEHGLDHLETLQHHDSEQIYHLAYKIINEFFNSGESDEELENMVSIGSVNQQSGDKDEKLGDNFDRPSAKFQF